MQSPTKETYHAEGSDGDVVLRRRQTLFEQREEFPFVNGDGNEVFTVETDGMGDVAGDCTLKDARTGEGVVLFDDGFSTFRNDWKVRDAEAEATIAELKRLGQPQRGNE